MSKLVLSLIFALSLLACTKDTNKVDESAEQALEIEEDFRITKAKEYILLVAKDPKSVQFKSMYISANYTYVCGRVNGKNSFDGYTGFQDFSFEIATSKLLIVDPNDRDSLIKHTYNCLIT